MAQVAPTLPKVFCGDFNSRPDSAVYKLVTTGRLHPGQVPPLPANADRAVIPPYAEYSHSLDLSSSYSTMLGSEPEITNVHGPDGDDPMPKFADTLDYVFTSGLAVASVLRVPALVECMRERGLPDSHQPSDHLPLAAALTFTM